MELGERSEDRALQVHVPREAVGSVLELGQIGSRNDPGHRRAGLVNELDLATLESMCRDEAPQRVREGQAQPGVLFRKGMQRIFPTLLHFILAISD